MTSDGDDGTFVTAPLPGATFGKVVRLREGGGAAALLAAMQADPEGLPVLLYANDGLLMLPGMDGIADDPTLLVALSQFFGPEVENYRETLTLLNRIHEAVPEIMIVSNTPPTRRKPPARPEPPLTADGRLPTQFPHRRGSPARTAFSARPVPSFTCSPTRPSTRRFRSGGSASYAA